VICLKTRTFAVSQTTHFSLSRLIWLLWFAWKLVLLQYRKQHFTYFYTSLYVVICLKTRTFAVSQTTLIDLRLICFLLWFAWKLVLLQYRKQRGHCTSSTGLRCDLLENSYFCSIANNIVDVNFINRYVVICLKTRTFAVSQTTTLRLFLYNKQVVICLKTRTFAVSQTTIVSRSHNKLGLWFAWKLVLLQYRKQQILDFQTKQSGCDLLENSYFCSIANNLH